MQIYSQIAKSADLDGNGKIDYEEYTKYLSMIDLRFAKSESQERQLAQLKEKTKNGPDFPPVKKITEKTAEMVRILRTHTNFNKLPIEKLISCADFPFDDLGSSDLSKLFGQMDEITEKYKVTILNSPKAALLWYFYNKMLSEKCGNDV